MRSKYFIYCNQIINKISTYSTFYIVLLILILYSFIVLLKLQLSVNLNFYNAKVIDLLPDSTTSVSPPVAKVFFHETSGKGKLNSRQSCSVESAAKAHPNWEINIFIIGSIFDETIDMKYINALKNYPNIQLSGLDIIEYASGTPLETMIRDGKLNQSQWQISHTSDALRYLSLYKWGGVYLDLDVIVAKSFEDLENNWGARENDLSVAAGAISFSLDKLGREIAEAAIQDFKMNFDGKKWGNNGPGVMQRVLEKICNTHTIANMYASTCKGFGVYGPELFYPISWRRAKDYFTDKNLVLGEPYGYHTWNHITEKYKVKNNSLYAQLAKKYCPEIYNAYDGDFEV